MAKRVDSNQTLIVRACRKAGASVQVLSDVGKGCPDLLVGFRRANHLLEVKDPNQPLSKRRLTPQEAIWHKLWEGQVEVVYTEFDALRVIGAIK